MFRKLIPIFIISVCAMNCIAESNEASRLGEVTQDYAKCADSALANFPSDKEGQKAIKILYKAMIENIQKMVELEAASKEEEIGFFVDIMGKDMFVGFVLKSYSEGDASYKAQKQALNEEYKFDWRRVDKRLWSENGCNAIYENLKK